MSRRSGDLDPGLVAYFARTERMTPEQFHEMVNTKSGLLGISETSSDVRDLLERERTDARAADALAVFSYRVRQTIGAFAASLGGLDALVFAGGIGEHSATMRARILDGLEFLGLRLDAERNEANADVISRPDSAVTARVIPTDEESEIARSTVEVLKT
jgi:acetate kinase